MKVDRPPGVAIPPEIIVGTDGTGSGRSVSSGADENSFFVAFEFLRSEDLLAFEFLRPFQGNDGRIALDTLDIRLAVRGLRRGVLGSGWRSGLRRGASV